MNTLNIGSEVTDRYWALTLSQEKAKESESKEDGEALRKERVHWNRQRTKLI